QSDYHYSLPRSSEGASTKCYNIEEQDSVQELHNLSVHNEIHCIAGSLDYQDINSTDTYDVIPEISPETEVFQQKDVNFIARIKKGYFFDRWTAVISVPRKADKCVFASTVTDHMLRTNDFHWGIYVKQLVELKQHDKLLEIEGLCIAADRLYVLYEHLPGTRLTDHIEETLGEDTRLRYVMDITEGIGFIHSKGRGYCPPLHRKNVGEGSSDTLFYICTPATILAQDK
ncbi:hypothetical protein BSL78_25691, partial [Apostichopus japonicus]